MLRFWRRHCPDGVAPSRVVAVSALIFPCTIKSRSSLLAPAHPGGPGKRAVKRLWLVLGISCTTILRCWCTHMNQSWTVFCMLNASSKSSWHGAGYCTFAGLRKFSTNILEFQLAAVKDSYIYYLSCQSYD